ncbi:MAG: hypothetical protein IPO94_09000 [Saprospiraceae bacterium]|nr:hypothetical protein [Saprospiraceae bacterium]
MLIFNKYVFLKYYKTILIKCYEEVFLFIFIVLVVSCNQKPETAKSSASKELFDEKTELDSIMHVIDNETKMFFAGNVEGWRA